MPSRPTTLPGEAAGTSGGRLTLSVVMPNYNHRAQLEDSLGALLSQSRPADEIIVVDDGSTDGSLAWLREIEARNPVLRVIAHDANQGVVAAVNRGLAEARGDLIFFASADELVSPETLEALAAEFERDDELRLAVSAFTEWTPGGGAILRHDRASENGLWFFQPEEERRKISPEDFESLLEQRFLFLSINAAMFRRDAVKEAGGYDGALRWHCDWFLIYCIAFRHGFVAINRALTLFRVDEESYSAVGMRQPHLQREVTRAMRAKLREPAFADFRAALLRAPSAMSPFMRGMLTGMARDGKDMDAFWPVLRWWCGQVARGRRPGFVKRWVERMRGAGPEKEDIR